MAMVLFGAHVFCFRVLLVVTLTVVSYLATAPEDHIAVVAGISDKVEHFTAFATLAVLMDYSWPESAMTPRKIIALLCYGLLLEVVQYFLPYREFSLLDLLADGAGIAAYLLIDPWLRCLPVLRWRWRESGG